MEDVNLQACEDISRPLDSTPPANNDEGILSDFLHNSSLPIVGYLLKTDLRVSLKVFWFTVLVCLVGLLGFSAVVNYERLQDTSNVIVAETEKALPIWSVPFPAVTLCPAKGRCVSDPLRLEQFCDTICWQDVCSNDCNTLLDAVRTERGICYTFNAVAGDQIFKSERMANVRNLTNVSRPTENWDFHRGIQIITSVLVKQYPHAAQDISGRYRLRISILNAQNDTISDCTPALMDVFLHSPIDFPYKPTAPTTIPLNSMVQLRVYPKLVRPQRYLRYFTPSTTGCISQAQNPLKLFAIYSQNNCEMECHARYYLDRRGCALDHMPRSDTEALCNSSTNYRSYDVLDKTVVAQLRAENIPRSQFFRRLCNCLPACVEYRYRSDVGTYTLAPELWRMEANDSDGMTSQLTVEFAEDHLYPLVRSVRYGALDFVADFGGLVALGFGISIVSVLEVLFFCIIKPAVVR